jgi:hypothetical protein
VGHQDLLARMLKRGLIRYLAQLLLQVADEVDDLPAQARDLVDQVAAVVVRVLLHQVQREQLVKDTQVVTTTPTRQITLRAAAVERAQ